MTKIESNNRLDNIETIAADIVSAAIRAAIDGGNRFTIADVRDVFKVRYLIANGLHDDDAEVIAVKRVLYKLGFDVS